MVEISFKLTLKIFDDVDLLIVKAIVHTFFNMDYLLIIFITKLRTNIVYFSNVHWIYVLKKEKNQSDDIY